MPSTLTKNVRHVFPAGQNFPQYVNAYYYMHQYNGFRTLPGEDPNQILAFNGKKQVGSCLRFTPHPGRPYNSYYEPGVRSTTPYVGSEWSSATSSSGYLGLQRNKAYAKFKDKAIGESSQMGTFIAEGRESYGMIANRVTGLYRAYRELKRGNFRRFLRELSVKPKRKHRSVVRTTAGEASGLWLEYWFGWSPALNDLYNAYSILTKQDERGEHFEAAAGRSLPERAISNGGTSAKYRQTVRGFGVVKTGARVKLVNPNAAVRSSLGLNNPLAIAWEVVPFSFVVDWFTQFGNSLNALTDFAGFEISDGYTTTFVKASNLTESWYHADRNVYPLYSTQYQFAHFHHVRTHGLVQPVVLRPRIANFGTSVTRAATAVSLLTAIFLDR